MVGGDIVTPAGNQHIGDDVVGIYRVEADGSVTVVADIGAWSIDHPPVPDYFITTGVQYALEVFDGGFLVTDGHHNRVLRVGVDGDISELASFGDVVPTGIETSHHKVYIAEAGPIPHNPADAKIFRLDPRSGEATEIASGQGEDGAGLAVDVEFGPCHRLYALLQGNWNLPVEPENEGLPASADSGAIVQIGDDGHFTTIVEGLDQPTSFEFIGNTAFVVTLSGKIMEVSNITG
jgi:hypothetical protein